MSPRMRYSLPVSLFIIAIIILTLLPSGLVLAQAPTSTLDVRLSTTTPVVGSGDWAVIKVDYSCSSIYNTTCDDVVVSVPIPPELSQAVQDIQVLDLSGDTDATYSPTTATWTFTDDIAPGSAGTFTLMVRFPKGATPDGETATLRASATSTSAPPVTSKPLTLTATAEPRTRADKRFVSGGVLDINTVYRVEVCVPGTVGVVDVTDLDIRDTLPAGATFVSATGGGVYDPGTNTITWPNENILVSAGESCVGYDVTVQFPDATFNVGDEIRNDMEADVTYAGGATAFLSDFDLRLIQPPTPDPGFSKNGPTSASLGDIVTYTFTSTNAGTSPLDAGHMITDPIPAELEVTRITAGTHNQASTIRLQIEYQINGATTWNMVPDSPFTGAACVNVAPNTGGGCAGSITLGAGERITALRYTYLDALPYGFSATNSGFSAEVISSPINQIIVNTADARFSYNGQEILRPSERRTRVVDNTDPGARPSLDKAVSPDTVQSGDVVTYTLTLSNGTTNATALVNPQIADLLINELVYVPGSQTMISAPVGAPAPTFELIPNYNGSGRVLLNWDWDSYSLPSGEEIVIQFQAQIAPYTPAQSLSNTAYLAGWDNQPGDIWIDSCTDSSADTYDFDNDGNTQEQICSSTISSVTLAAAAKSGSHKLVMGQLDTKWTYDPEFGFTVPGGSATYQLTITNTGTIPIGEITLLDILPWVGDVGVRSFDQVRGTQWRPFLSEPIAVPSGASAFYSTQNNPCRAPDLSVDPADDSPGCDAPVWSSTPPADITTVQSFKVEFGDLILMPEESVTLTVYMQAPYGDPASPPDPNLIAWNSFGYRARAINSTEYLLSSDPPRVGIKRSASEPPGYGNYVWLDTDKDGIQDGGEPGINGARVDLFRDDDGVAGSSPGDTFVGTKITGPDDAGNPGYYLFSESFDSTDPRYPGYLEPGDYYAQFTPPLGYGLTAIDQGGNDAADSDANQTTGLTEVTTLILGEFDMTWDAGVTASTAVGNYVWIDRNENGLQDEAPGDGVNGVTVRLYTSGGTLVGTTTTSNDPFGRPGYYLFDNLTPGDYYVEFVAPSGFTFTSQNSGDDAADSDANTTTGQTATFTLLANQYDPNWDAGLIVPASTLQLGNLVWRDLDNNGVYDPSAGETGINGATVSLYRDSNNDGVPDPGEHVGTTTTSTHLGQPGWYQFSNLEDGDYIAVLEVSNFAFDGALRDLHTSTGNDPAPDPDTDIDQDDNGFAQGARIISEPITLSANSEPNTIVDGDDRNGNQTLDFGLIGGAALGNRVWFDADSNGVQDAGELGVAGITVELLDSTGTTVLKTTTTNTDGIYGFADLAPGDYRVRFSDLPSGHTFTSLNSGSDTELDSDADPSTSTTALINLSLNETDMTWDAGLVANLASLGDRVWDDLNRDGIQDAGEVGVNDVTVSLYRADGSLVATTTTANDGTNDGIYGFSDLPPGDYYVVFSDLPVGYATSPINTGTDDTLDSDADRVTGQTAITTLDPGENDPTWDLGIFTYASIGDRVWNDYDRDGIQDGGESGVPNVTVRLYQPGSHIPLETTTTDSSGNYSFTGLIPDLQYYVEFVMPSGYKASSQNQGGDDSLDSDASLLTFQTEATTLTEGENDVTWDFGIYQTASISNLAWLDLDADGIQDANETNGVPGVQVILYNQSGSAIDSTVTNTSGLYEFRGLEPGTYSLGFIIPDTFILSPQDASGNDATDSDASGSAPIYTTIQTELIPGENDSSWDIGLFQPSALGDRVWHDLNANGVQDPGEDGIANVGVTLYTPGPDGVIGGGDDVLVGTDTTDVDGNYRFDNLPPGNYYVVFGPTPGYTNVSPANSPSGDSDNNSDADHTTRTTPLITLPSSTSDMSWDMGVYNTVDLGNYVWVDTNADGIQNEPASNGVNGVTVSLYTINGMFVDDTITANDGLGNPGYYLFPDLAPGNYYVVFSDIPADHVFTQRDQGGDNTLDSDVLQVITGLGEITGVSSMISLTSGQPDDLTWDAGIFPVISVGDVVWLDFNANGIQDPAERVWTDVNGNGSVDVGETSGGVPGVRVELYNDSGDLVDVTYTNLDGNYLFEGLFPDTYHIVFSDIPAVYQRSPENRGADDAVDSDADSTYTIPDFPLTTTDLTRDMGLYELASIGDYVWHDINANGIQDVGEPGIPNVLVRLVGTDGTGAAVDLSTTTDANGAYRFDGLRPGTYHVEFTMPTGYDRASAPDRGTDDALDSDIDTTTLRTPNTELYSGEEDLTWDAGFYSDLRLGNLVWHDLNNNGLADDGATGIENVLVLLTGTDGLGNSVSLSDTTDSNGLYLFENLMPGEYVVTIADTNFTGTAALAATSDQPAYVSSSGTNGSLSGDYEPADDPDNNTDNDDNGSLSGSAVVAQPITLRSQDEPLVGVDGDDHNGNLTVDFGFFRPLSLGNLVWDDVNNNGLVDGGETGIDGVTVQLYLDDGDNTYDAGDTLITTDTTSGGGLYNFENLAGGNYFVVIPASNFSGTEPLAASGGMAAYSSSTGINGSATGPYEAASANDLDNNDDGTTVGSDVVSFMVTLSDGGEPPSGVDADGLNGNQTVDFGLFRPASLGNLVWLDRDADGIQDGGDETGIDGVTVTLLDSTGNPVDGDPHTAGVQQITTTTVGGGLYEFTNLASGDYQVGFTLPTDYYHSRTGAGTADTDSDANPATGHTATTTLTPGENDPSWDTGLYQLVRLGNLVWDDVNDNGTVDLGENGINGVTVNLTGTDGAGNAVNLTTTTASGGLYLFDNLVPGNYVVTIPASNFTGAGALAPSGDMPAYRTSTGTNGSATGTYEAAPDPDDNTDDNDDNGSQSGGDVVALEVTLRSQDEPAVGVDTDDTNGNLTVDFGFFRPLSLGNLVWNDLDNDKTYDSGTESGIDGVTVQLYRDTDGNNVYTAGTDTLVTTTTTAGGGLYLFDNLIPGDYVVVIPASNFTGTGELRYFRSSDGGATPDTATDPDTGDTNNDDNGVGPSSGIATGLVSSGAVTLSLDGEPITDGDTNSNSNLAVDFGFYSLSVGNLVWIDVNNNGIKDATENGWDGRTVRIYYDIDGDGTIESGAESTAVATINTSNGGHYFFGGLRSGGNYEIRVTTPGADWVSSTGGANGVNIGPYEPGLDPDSDAVDNNDNGTHQTGSNIVRSPVFQVNVGTAPIDESDLTLPTGVTDPAANNSSNLSIDFGLFNHARMGDLVWIDTNGNGVQDPSETTGVANITVTLYDSGGTEIAHTDTDASGLYSFSYLDPGDYYVIFDLGDISPDYAVSPANAGGTAATNSDADEGSGQTGTFNLVNGENDTAWDMGIYPRVSLGNLIWDDLNNDGLVDVGEPGVPGVQVDLYRDTNGNGTYDAGTDTFVATQDTDGNGNYLFERLLQGDYLVVIPDTEFASGAPLYRYRSSTGQNGLGVNVYEPAPDPDDGVGAPAYNNINNDDNGTDHVGGYTFTRAITLNPSYEPTNDGDADPNTNLTLDLGFFQNLNLGNLVWEDTNNNGIYELGEPLLENVVVELYMDDGSGGYDPADTLINTTTTGVNGVYNFDDLIPGNYIVVLPASNFSGTGVLAASGGFAAYRSSTGVNGVDTGPYEGGSIADPDNDVDNEDDGSTNLDGDVVSLPITLARDSEPPVIDDGDGINGNQTVDFGLFRPASLGDRVWNDLNANGIQDAGEAGITGVIVSLLDGSSNPVLDGAGDPITTTTDGTGAYRFDNLIPGTYSVSFTRPSTYIITLVDQGADGAVDSDANRSTGDATGTTTLVKGQHDPNWDAGLYQPISIGNQVWYDTDNDGVIDGSEVGINGVRVELFYDANNNGTIEDNSGTGGVNETIPVAITTTATGGGADGTYLFTTRNNTNSELLNPGTYRVGIPASQFDATTGVLRGYYSSRVTMSNAGVLTETAPADPDGSPDVDGDDNGARQTSGFYNGGVLSLPVTIEALNEPINEDPDRDDPNPSYRPNNSDNQTVDFGFYTASVGNIVWDDNGAGGVGTLADGLRNGTEPGIANVRVRLYAQNGTTEISVGPDGLLGTSDDATGGMLTDSNGNYTFGRLPGGYYRVQIELPTGYVSTHDTPESATPSNNTDDDDNGIGSDQTATTVMSNAFTLVSGSEPTVDYSTGSSDDPTIDFGIVRYYSLGNQIWEDLDNDGLLNNGEVGLNGVEVRLYMFDGVTTVPARDITGALVPNQDTIDGGYYRFDNLPAGDYVVEVIADNFTGTNPLRGYFSSTGAGQEADPDSDGDNNDNGLDTPVAGAFQSGVVTLGEDSGTAEPTGDNDPATNPLDSSEAPDTQSNRTVDFGFVPIYSLGNRVWYDTNNNGSMDAGEPGIEDVTVRLYEADGTTQARDILGNLVANQDTDANGYYRFDNLLAGDYIVEIVDTNFTGTGTLVTYVNSSGINQEADPDSDGDRNDNGLDIPVLGAIQSDVVTLGGSAEPTDDNDPAPNPDTGESRNDRSNRTVDFGFYQPVSIGNQVWYDADNSGTFDSGELGIGGVRVELFYDADDNGSIDGVETTPVAVTTTAADGTYLFTERTDSDGNSLAIQQLLNPGTYVVGIPASEFDPVTGTLRGLFSSGTTAGADGTRSETAAANPETNASDTDDNGQRETGAFYTGGVLSLPVTVEALNEPINETPDSDPNPSYRPDNSDNQTVDFGFYGMSVGNLVWRDDGNGGGTANDGLRNGSEAAISGVTVRLLASDGTLLQSTTTDANGRYLFTGLAEGEYIVEVDIPSNTQSSRDPADAGDPDALDNDDNGVNLTATTVRSNVVLLDAGAAPTGESDQGVTTGAGMGDPAQTDNPNTPDGNSDLHVDFGFVPLDWGDLLDPNYPTVAANNGPRHGLTTGLQIGATVDTELDGQPSADADGDGTDEDGVTFPTFYTGLPANVTVDVTNTTGRDATLYGFIDFNNDGDFADAGETVTATIASGPTGAQTLTFTVPNDAVVDTNLGARFRLSTDALLTATGPASDGEVEDYLITVTPTYSLGNRVWHDRDNSGDINPADGATPGIDGVTVRLMDSTGADVTDATGATVDPVTTTGGGYYRFDNLLAGDYLVEIAAGNFAGGAVLETYVSSSGVETVPDVDNNDNGLDTPVAGAIQSDVVTLGGTEPTGETDPTTDPEAGEAVDSRSNRTVDFGFYQPASLGNFVWDDLNGNGVQELGEPSIEGVIATLTYAGPDGIFANGDDTTSTDTTNSAGEYLFTDLAPGNYRVSFSNLPSGYDFTLQDTGTGTTPDEVDSDVDPSTGTTPDINLSSGENDLTWDAGINEIMNLGDRVWDDANGNGVQDTGEVGVMGVTVTLYNATTGTQVGTPQPTDISGNYLFTDVPPGDYYIVFSNLPSGYTFSLADQGGDDTADSDADLLTGRTSTFTMVSGQTDDLTRDAGIYQLLTLGNLVWEDTNNNGSFDSGTESGLGGVTVELYRDDNGDGVGDVLVTTETTDSNGLYQFTDLPQGDYVVVIPASNFNVGNPLEDFLSSTGTTDLTAGPHEHDPGVSTETNADNDDNGNLTGGDVVASVVYLRAGDEPDTGVDGDGRSGNQTVDFGFIRPTGFGDRVWDDVNGNGVQDGGEVGVTGVTVTLYNATTGDPVGTPQTTDGSGNYLFTNLAPGDYYVIFSNLPSGYGFSPTGQGDVDTDSNADPATGQSGTISLESGAPNDLDWDAGIYQLLSLGNLVWNDLDNNGIVNGTESGIDGVTVQLYRDTDSSGTYTAGDTYVTEQTTTGGGFYEFTNLPQGDYVVVIPASNFNVGNPLEDFLSSTGTTDLAAGPYEPGADPETNADIDDNGTNQVSGAVASSVVQLRAAAEPDTGVDGDGRSANQTVDFGFFEPASVGNLVWNDVNGNGVQESGETGMDGVEVRLYRSDGTPVGTTSTSGGGIYTFSDLPPGDYYVEFGLPSGYNFSPTGAGTTDTDSNANPANGRSDTFNLEGGENDLTWDAGIYQLLSLGNLVWADTNNNGIVDGTESGIDGVTVQLYRDTDGDGIGDTYMIEQTTSGGGNYQFTNLPQGDYVVVIPDSNFGGVLNGYLSSTGTTNATTGPNEHPGVSTETNTDNDDNGNLVGSDVLASVVYLRAAAEPDTGVDGDGTSGNQTVDFGFFLPASIGDRVWNDVDANGVQDGGEVGVDGVTVTLYSNDGTPVATTTTSGGAYSFTNLAPGDYYVGFSNLPGGYIFSPVGQGTNTTDSDADRTTGLTSTTSLVSGENDTTWDGGIYWPASLGNFVWDDANANGIQESGELGVENVTVRLIQNGNVIETVQTDANGAYLFDELGSGDYLIEIDRPFNWQVSPQYQGGNSANDNNIDRDTLRSESVTLNPGANNPDMDIGLYRLASVGNRVWEDFDKDGIFDSGSEEGVRDIPVYLYREGETTPIRTAVTDPNGNFRFDELEPGNYYIRFDPPTGWLISNPDQGADGEDSDADPNNGSTAVFTLNIGTEDMTWWMGMSRPPTSISLLDFSVERQSEGNLLRWETGSELKSAGFEIYRSETDNRADAVQVSQMILARGVSGGGASYDWLDSNATADVSYHYWLVEVEIDGSRNEYYLEQQPQVQDEWRIFLPVVVR